MPNDVRKDVSGNRHRFHETLSENDPGCGPLEARYAPDRRALFLRMRKPPATSIAEFETNTGK